MQITNQIYKILSQFSDLLLDFSKLFYPPAFFHIPTLTFIPKSPNAL